MTAYGLSHAVPFLFLLCDVRAIIVFTYPRTQTVRAAITQHGGMN